MMTHYTQAGPQVVRRWLSPLAGSLVVATAVMVTLLPAGPAAAAECFVNEVTAAVQDTPSWEAISSPIQTLPTTLTRNCFCWSTPYLNNSKFVLGKADNPGITTLIACLSPNTWKSALPDHATLSPIGKVNLKLQPRKAFTLPYSSKKQVLVIRTTPPEFKRSTHYTPAPTIIGPVQEFQNSPPSSEQNMTQAIPLVPPMDKPSTLFEDHHWGPLNQFQGLQRLPNGESHRMNMTTALALHGRDCVSDCP